jgi:hypothetical protein
MRSPDQFIVKPIDEKRYADTIDIAGIDFIVTSDQEDAKNSNREAVVHSLPLRYDGPIEVGDHLLVHHNVFKFYYDMKGRQRNGKSYFRDGLFFIDDQQFFMWRKPDGDWQSVGDSCFLAPVPERETWLTKFSGSEPLLGQVRYSNESLRVAGVKEGDIVFHQPECEYEFRVSGEVLYRMFTRNITIQYEREGV